MLMNGPMIRHRPLARRVTITETRSVTAAIAGPETVGAPAGRSWTLSKAIGSTLTAINMVTVPVTTGVKIRRRVGSHQASAIWITQHTTSRLMNVAGPAAEIVVTMIAMNSAAGQESTIWPAPNRQNWNAWRAVIAALISSAAKTLQIRKVSSSPEERIATATFSAVGASMSAAPWKPTTSAIDGEQFSSGSNLMGWSALPAVNWLSNLPRLGLTLKRHYHMHLSCPSGLLADSSDVLRYRPVAPMPSLSQRR